MPKINKFKWDILSNFQTLHGGFEFNFNVSLGIRTYIFPNMVIGPWFKSHSRPTISYLTGFMVAAA